MKNKAPLTLMEQLTMILVFAIAAAVCLRLFMLANIMSENAASKEQAVAAVQNAAEALKLANGDFDQLAAEFGGERTDEGWQISYDENWDAATGKAAYAVKSYAFDNENPLLGSAHVSAEDKNGKQLYQITVCWQEACDE